MIGHKVFGFASENIFGHRRSIIHCFEEDLIIATMILVISEASFLIYFSFLFVNNFVSSHISNQKRVSSASSNAIRIFDTNSALLLAQFAAQILAAMLLPLRAICAAMVLPVKFFGKASASLNTLTAKDFVLYVISGTFIVSPLTN